MKRILLISALGLTFSFAALNAQIVSHGINAKQSNQKARIIEGAVTGELTRAETVALSKEQRKIQKMETLAKSDGVVTRRERKRIKSAQRKANRHIARQKND